MPPALTGMRTIGLAVIALTRVAWAQDVDLQAFRPAMDSRGHVTVNGSDVLGHAEGSFGLVTTWGVRVVPAVDNVITPTLQGAFGLFGVGEIGVSAPFHVISGDFTAQGIGDVGLHGKARILDGQSHPVGLALVASVFVPAHERESWLGEDETAIVPSLVIDRELGAGLRVAANLGYRRREARTVMTEAMRMTTGSELPFGLGASYALVPGRFDLVGEVYGGAPLVGQSYHPIEAVTGVKLYLAKSSFFTLGGGLGTDAEARAFLGIVFEPSIGERAHGAGDDERPEPPRPTPVVDLDRDGDGLVDRLDRCPDDPEDPDGFQDRDGCPDPDNDGDRIADLADFCPNQPEDYDGHDDTDGCPEPEKVTRSSGSIDYLDDIYFETDSAVIKAESFGILDAIAGAVKDWSDIRLLEVQGHADERGSAEHNLRLTQARAESVVRYLTEKGVAAGRLRARGFGEARPVDRGHSAAAWAKNRRVQFVIVEQVAVP